MINLVDVLKAEYEQAIGTYNAAWEFYMAEFVFRWHSDGDIHEPHPPASFGGREACREIARAGKAMDAARAKYEAVLAQQNRIANGQTIVEQAQQIIDAQAAELEATHHEFAAKIYEAAALETEADGAHADAWKAERRIARLRAVAKGRRIQVHFARAMLTMSADDISTLSATVSAKDAQIATLTEIIRTPAKPTAALTPTQVGEETAALVTMFAGQTVSRDEISAKFGKGEAVTRRALFEAWSAGKALYDGKAFKFMEVTA